MEERILDEVVEEVASNVPVKAAVALGVIAVTAGVVVVIIKKRRSKAEREGIEHSSEESYEVIDSEE